MPRARGRSSGKGVSSKAPFLLVQAVEHLIWPSTPTDSPLCHSVSSSPAEPVAVGAVGGRLSLLWDAVPVSDDPALGGNHTEPPTPSLSSLISNSEMAPSVGKQTEFSCLCLLNASIVTPLCQVKSFLLFSLNQL